MKWKIYKYGKKTVEINYKNKRKIEDEIYKKKKKKKQLNNDTQVTM